MSERLKILPLLVFVAMLAFSVRLAEVVTDVRTLSGSAHAEAAKPETPEPADKKTDPAQKDDMAAKPAEKSSEDKAKAEIAEKDKSPKEGDTKKAEEPSKAAAGKAMEWKDSSDSDISVEMVKKEMFEDLTKRREFLDKREKEIETREALLRAAEQEMDRKFQEMQSVRGEIENLLKKQSEEEKARILSLVKIYEGMKPKEAARIFDTLDLDVLVNVVSSMSERKLSPILASMSPERAKALTILLAEQKKLPELPDN